MTCLCCTSICFRPRKFNGGNQKFENWRRFSLVFVKNSKRHARGIVCWKRTIIMANTGDHKSCVFTQICIAYNLILTCRWYVKSDVNVFSITKTNVGILHYETDIAYKKLCCKQLARTVLSIYLSTFWGIREQSKKVSFSRFWIWRRHELAEFHVMIRCFSLTLRHSLTKFTYKYSVFTAFQKFYKIRMYVAFVLSVSI